MVGKAEWATIKALHKNRCVIGGETEKQVGILEQVHIKARSRGGTQVVPMCPTHHKMYDQGKLSATQLKKLGLTPAKVKRLTPRKPRKLPQTRATTKRPKPHKTRRPRRKSDWERLWFG